MKQLPVLEPGDKPRKATWYTLTLPGDSPCARVGHSCSYLPPVGNAKRGKVFIVGGANPNRSFSDVHAMDLGKHQWDLVTCKGLLPRYEHASFIPSCTSDHIWVFGGANQSGNRNCLQVLNPGKMQWMIRRLTAPPPPTPPKGLHDTEAWDYFSCSCFIALPFDVIEFTFLETLTWSQPETLGNPPSPRHGHVMVAAGTKLFIHGGLAGDKFYDDLHCIDISKQGTGACLTLGGCGRQHWTLLKFDSFLPPGRLDHSMCIIPWPVTCASEKEDSNSLTLNHEAEKRDSADKVMSHSGDSHEEGQTDTLLCLVFGGMNTEGEIYDDCIVTIVD
uniref:Rab9 effector protein with kelch motifs n=1 Tax=Macaca nemestrina TaxID=9545 RepID=A0A2K6DT13_MACNE